MVKTSQNKAISTKNKSKDRDAKGKSHNNREIKPPKKITERYLYNAGLAYLQRFPASTHHFRTIMGRKINKSCRFHTDQSEESCQKLLDNTVVKFQELELLNDDNYTQGMITSYRRRGLSTNQIIVKLSAKGIDRGKIKQTINTHDADEYGTPTLGDLHAALTFARKRRIGPFDTLQKKEEKKSLSMMARAGYSYDIAQRILTMNMNDVENEDLFIN